MGRLAQVEVENPRHYSLAKGLVGGWSHTPVILGLAGSPRRHGNTETLLDACLAACREQGVQTEKIVVSQLDIHPCKGCNWCARNGECIQRDDMDVLYPRLATSEGLVVAAPIYFYGLPAQLKALIDRTQIFWNRKYKLQQPVRLSHPTRGCGAFISVGATSGRQLFAGAVLTVKYFFDALDLDYCGDILLRGIDAKGEVNNDGQALSLAARLGKELVARLSNEQGRS